MFRVRAIPFWGTTVTAFTLGFGLLTTPVALAEQVAIAASSGGQIMWRPTVSAEVIQLTVTGAGETSVVENFERGRSPSFSVFGDDGLRPDGLYRYRLLAASNEAASVVQSGSFEIVNGEIVLHASGGGD